MRVYLFCFEGNALTLLTCWLLSATLLATCSLSDIVTRVGAETRDEADGNIGFACTKPQCCIVTFRYWLHMVQLRERLWSAWIKKKARLTCNQNYHLSKWSCFVALLQTGCKPPDLFAKCDTCYVLAASQDNYSLIGLFRQSFRGVWGYENVCVKHITVSMTGHMLTVCPRPTVSVSASVNRAWLLTHFISWVRSPPKKRTGF